MTDPAGNWKTFTSDVSGNLTTVLEPNPAGGTFTTSYTYDWMNHLIGSSMTRGSTTQTRTFVYNNAGQLTSATNPESGTVTYSYSADTTLWGKTDAKGQLTVYGYDASKRVTSVHVYPYGWGGGEDTCQLVTYGYDAGTNGLGRLTSAAYGVPNPGSGYPISGSCPGMANGYAYQDSYTYDAPGQVTNKTFTLTTDDPAFGGWPTSASIGIGYTYDSAGRLSTATYPTTGTYWVPVPTYTYSYDGMGRPVGMTDGGGTQWVQNGQYDAAGHMTSIGVSNGSSYFMDSRTKMMTYNVNGQLTALSWVYTTMPWYQPQNIQYTYSATNNNGQITQMTDISGETVSYAYDTLKRLTGATAVSGGTTAWTQAFGYDGFGNMTSKTLNGGANMAPAVDPTTNRLTSGYDANGNMLTGFGLTMTYDGRDRVASATPTYSGTEYYGYAPDSKRIYRWNPTTGTEEWTFYGAKGERIGSFGLNASGTYYFYPTQTNLWSAGQLISNANGFVFRDRVGSDRETGAQYYPYGDEITSTANGTEKYGTYFRDSFTAMDYADQRYYTAAYGRFNTPDPYKAAANGVSDPENPQSWNRYAYVQGDPVNGYDPHGLFLLSPPGDPGNPDCGDMDCAGDFYGVGGFSLCDFEPEECISSSILYYSPPSGGSGGGGGGSAPVPCDFSAQSLLSYMQGTPAYVNGQPSSKAFASLANATAIMTDAVADNVDPRLLIAISFLESKWGGSSGSQSNDNAFGLMGKNSAGMFTLINFTSDGGWQAGIALAANTLESHIANGQTSVSSRYSGNSGAYCVGAGCNAGAVASKLTALGGSPSSLSSPCYESNGQFYEKP